jgi:hypothetical protein
MRANRRTRRTLPHADQRARTTVCFAVARTRATEAAHDPFITTLRVPTSIGEPTAGKAVPPGSSTT